MIDQEEMYDDIQHKNWEHIINVIHKDADAISSDTLSKQAANVFIKEFLRNIDLYPVEDKNIIIYLEQLFMLHEGHLYNFETDDYKNIICQIVKRKKDNNLLEAYNYAKKYFPNEDICKNVISLYEQTIPKEIEHSQSDRILVTGRKKIGNVDYRINLFKSEQEGDFFYALKATFDSYQIYPNVAISCLLNWYLLKEELTKEERDYFFTGIVDFVVFDQAAGFKPIHFFELDSIYHDNEERKCKDALKDNIFAKAGVKIMRIRKKDKTVSTQEFINLIREVTK
jgi:hypothetical protein